MSIEQPIKARLNEADAVIFGDSTKLHIQLTTQHMAQLNSIAASASSSQLVSDTGQY